MRIRIEQTPPEQRSRPHRRLPWWGVLLALLALGLPPAASAAPGLQITHSAPHYSGATYRETVRDLRVKVLGGHADVTREWRDGRWWFNPYWADLQFRYDSNNSDGEPDQIIRYDLTYERVEGAAAPTYAYQARLRIAKTASGWRWSNRGGDWIDYDSDGRTLAAGDRNANRIELRRNLGGFIEGVIDTNALEVITYELDELGQPQRAVDYTGREVLYTWNGNDLESVRDVRGQTWSYAYQSLDNTRVLAARTDPRGHTTRFEHQVSAAGNQCIQGEGMRWVYDAGADAWQLYYSRCTHWVSVESTLMLRQISDDIGLKNRYSYFFDAEKVQYTTSRRDGEGLLEERRVDLTGELIEHKRNGRVLRLTEKDGRHRIHSHGRGLKTRTERDQWHNPIAITHPDGSTVEMAYDPNHNGLTRRIDERGIRTEHSYDERGNRTRTLEAAGLPEQRTTDFTYQSNGLLASRTRKGETAAADATTSYEYDAFGNLTRITDPQGHQQQFGDHDALGNPRTLIDARGHTWTFTYDAAGNRLTRTSALGIVETTTWDEAGNRGSDTDGRGNTTTHTYDGRNRRISTTYADGSQESRTYNLRDLLLSRTDEEGRQVLTLEYDGEGNLAAATDGVGNRTAYDHGLDADSPFPGLLNRIDYPTYSETYGYDLRDRRSLRTRILADGQEQTRRYRYDGTGNLIGEWDELERPSTHAYDGLGRLTQSTDTAAQTTGYAYDARDNLIQVTNARAIAIRRYAYDRNDRQTAEILPDEATIESAYDAAGNLIQRTDPKGRITRHDYDEDGRLQSTEYFADATALAADSPEQTVTYDHDENANLTGYQDGTTSAVYGYDARDRRTSVSLDFGPFTKDYAHSYHANGLKAGYTDPEGNSYAYQYDAANRLSRIDIPDEGSLTVNTYRWSEPAAVTLPGGIVQSTEHDALLRSAARTSTAPDETELLQYRFTYDAVGNITAIATEHGQYSYDYDEADRLTSADNPTLSDEAYSYDAVGNRLTAAETGQDHWQYDARDRLLDAVDTQYTYDAAGSLIEQSRDTSTRRHVYDVQGRLSEVRDSDDALIAQYRYDPMGRRIRKTVGTQTTYFLYAEEGLIGEYDQAGTRIAAYGYRPGSAYGTAPLWQHRNGAYGYYHRNHLGTPVLLTDKTNAVLWRGRYKAFGEAAVSGVVENPLRFPGQYFDSETGLHYNYFRDYDPSIGRYIESDPIGLDGGLNGFSYALANPIKWFDSKGKSPASANGIPTIPPPERLPPHPPGKPSCELLYSSCVARCQKLPICKLPRVGPVAKGGCVVVCTVVWITCRLGGGE